MNDPILDLHATPDARLHPASISAVTLRDDFWQPRRDINVAQTLPSQYEHLEADGVFDRFRRCTGAPALHPLAPETPQDIFRDSDVYKWLEAASSVLVEPQPDVRALVDRVADLIVAAQCPDGYLDTFYILQPEKDRWEKLADNHQLYCMGHFIQAAIAHFRATGETKLLDVARRMADCIDHDFGLASDGKIEGTDGHEEIEMALVELYRATGEVRYLKLAQFLLEVRGRGSVGGDNYHQDHVPLRDLDRVTGHAVRALYYAAGATDLALETGESAIWQALDAQWQNFTARQMYVSGGAGSRWEGEAFGFDWELPNQRAYTETCAAIATVMWAFRIGQRRGEARYFDVLERALYNGVLSGLSLSGDQYFYQNPLADDGHHRREQWFGCACCPPNIARLLAQLPGYFYSTSDEGIWAHLFARSEATLELPAGRVTIAQETDYPRAGAITFRVSETPAAPWSLRVRVPEWAQGATAEIEGEMREVTAGQYLEIRRVWQVGDAVTLTLPMTVRPVRAHPYALENSGRVAVLRGPLLYCAESADNPGVDLRDVGVDLNASFEAQTQPELAAAAALRAPGWTRAPADFALYAPANAPALKGAQPIELTLIPYYAWANRGAGQMQVWLRANAEF